MDATNNVRHKIQTALEQGFKCAHCGFETVTLDGSTPAVCQNCATASPTLVWKDRITNLITVESLPLT